MNCERKRRAMKKLIFVLFAGMMTYGAAAQTNKTTDRPQTDTSANSAYNRIREQNMNIINPNNRFDPNGNNRLQRNNTSNPTNNNINNMYDPNNNLNNNNLNRQNNNRNNTLTPGTNMNNNNTNNNMNYGSPLIR